MMEEVDSFEYKKVVYIPGTLYTVVRHTLPIFWRVIEDGTRIDPVWDDIQGNLFININENSSTTEDRPIALFLIREKWIRIRRWHNLPSENFLAFLVGDQKFLLQDIDLPCLKKVNKQKVILTE